MRKILDGVVGFSTADFATFCHMAVLLRRFGSGGLRTDDLEHSDKEFNRI